MLYKGHYDYLESKYLLIMDQATMHSNQEVINEFERNDTDFQIKPKWMTSVFQPLDVIINKPFKDYIRKKIYWILLWEE